jgi:predicted deacylase
MVLDTVVSGSGAITSSGGLMGRFLGVPVRRGEVVRDRVKVAEYADNSPVTIPVVTIGGTQDGPTLYLQAGIHGDELTGIEVCRRAIAEIDPGDLAGTVVAVPVANVPSHLTRTRGYLNEERWLIDMNRYWPGAEQGLLTERLAHLLFTEFVTQADLTIDLHSALDGADIAPFVYVWPSDTTNGTHELREKVAHAYGTKYIYYHAAKKRFGTSDVPRSLPLQADMLGKVVMLAEMGESRRVSNEFVPLGVAGIRNVLITMGMLKGEPTPPPAQRDFHHFEVVHATSGGGLRLGVALGDEVAAGQQLAEIVDVFGQPVEQLVSPVDGFVLRVMRLGSAATGAEVVWVGH